MNIFNSRSVLTYFAIAVGLIFTANADAIIHSNKNSNRYIDNVYSVPSSTTSSIPEYTNCDQKLAKETQERINSSKFMKAYEGVTAKVVDGNVTLEGSVKTGDEKAKIEEEVRRISGVKNVTNKIEIKNK